MSLPNSLPKRTRQPKKPPPFEERNDSGETTADIEAGSLSVSAGTESAADSELADLPQIENSAVPQEILITVESFADDLPPLSLSEDLPTGFYTIVFEVAASNGTVFNSIEKPFFYIAGKKLVVEDIISYLPGVSPTMRIVPPGEKVLLEASINADSALDTYIVWYNGKHQISEGYVADGAGRIFWTAPKQTGFQVVNIEVFPFNPSDKQGFGIRGLTHSVSLPLSARHGRTSHFERLEAQASRWYRLWGNTADAKDPSSAASKLVAADGTEELWLPVSGTYGLSVGTNDVYKLPGSFFRMIKKGEGSGEILLRFAPLGYAVSEKPILRAELRDESDSVCVIRLSLLEDSLVLSAAHNEEVLQTRLPVTVDGGSFINAAIDFQFFEESLSVSIGLESVETGEIESWETLSAAFVPSGAGSLQFGFSDDDDDGEASDSASVVVTEIAVLYNEVSPAAVITTEDEESAVEEEADKESDAETDTLTADVSLTPDVHDNIQQ